ncbi:hypothetical protein LSCM1_06044 [Leishmania martiniquensis]|uniref:Peptidase C51 domain-containing protein n=1 Tax=Leishmania martiniquensis TaxID=1580590 RepID=A0A836KQ38_9TRYP|nr:hypothetical protein LSCM1_06044 [Leishmania martiniquensis]
MVCASSAEAGIETADSNTARSSRACETVAPKSMGKPQRSHPAAGSDIDRYFKSASSATQMSRTLDTTRRNRRVGAVTLHEVCGYTHHGVPAYSNGTSSTWTNKKSFREGVFMGYQWQCVEFARRWLWVTHRLLLPQRSCAYCFAYCTHVYRLKEGPSPFSQRPHLNGGAAAEQNGAGLAASSLPVTTATELGLRGPRDNKDAWEKVPAKFVKQGSLVPPVADSLIVYPMSFGSPWGHIGVITAVDLDRCLVYVADQNRFFHDWNGKSYSAVFRLEYNKGRFYIRDHESECTGWLTFPTLVEGH